MAVSTQTIKVGQADALAEYYAKKEEELIVDLRSVPENAQKSEQEVREMARVHIARSEATAFGRNPDKAEYELRQEWATQTVGGSAAYYATDDADRLVHLRGGKAGKVATHDELKDLFLGREGDRRLDDPHPKQIEAAARATGHTGDITSDVLEALRAGRDPQTGAVLTGAVAEQVAGYWSSPTRKDGDVSAVDITFSAPKGVSILAAFGSEETRESIYAAQTAAVDKALAFAEDQSVVNARRGKAGKDLHSIRAELTKVVAKNELTSRAGDPQLHTHTILSNYVKGEDGRITTLDSQSWHGATAAMDAFYLRALSEELYQRVGVRLEETVVGDKVRLAGVPGVSRQLEEQFSTRRQQINEALGERHKERERLESLMGSHTSGFERAYEAREAGLPQSEEHAYKAEVYQLWLETGTTPQAAALSTRSTKAEESEAEALARWSQTSNTPDGDKLLKMAQKGSAPAPKEELDHEVLWTRMESELTEKQASFTSSEAMSAALRLAPQGVSEREAMDAGRQFLSEHAVALDSAPTLDSPGAEWRHKSRGWTTEAVIAQRSKMNETAQRLASRQVQDTSASRSRFDKKPAFDEWKLVSSAARASAMKTLADEQEEAVAAVATGQALVTLNGKAGTGKTHAEAAICRMAQENDVEVTVLATRAQTASDLGAEIGANRYMTLHAFCDEERGPEASGRWDQGLNEQQIHRFHQLSSRVDEARLNGDETTMKNAEAQLEDFKRSIPGRDEANHLAGQRSSLERRDKVLKHANDAATLVGAGKALGLGEGRSALHEQREELIQAKEQQPFASGEFDKDKRHLVIVEEAGMTADDHLEHVLDFAAKNPNVQVLLSGDYAQLNAVQRSGGFREVLEHVEPVELNEIRRARHEWEREAQSQMHALPWDNSEETHQKAEEIVGQYEEHDRVRAAGTEDDIREHLAAHPEDATKRNLAADLAAQAAADWYMEHSAEREVPLESKNGKPQEPKRLKEDCGVWVPTIQMQTEIAAAIQERRYESGELDPDARMAHLQVSEHHSQEVQKGESIVFRGGIPGSGIKNGWKGEVLSTRPDGAISVRVTDERGKTFQKTVSKEWLQQGKVGLAYTSTVHASQGRTLDRGLYVHDPSKEDFCDRQLVYPAMTRSRESTEVLLVGDAEEAKGSLVRSMSTSNNATLSAARDAMPTQDDVEEALSLAKELGTEPSYEDAVAIAKQKAEGRALQLAQQQQTGRLARSKVHSEIAAERKRAEERKQQRVQTKAQSRERVRMF